MVVTAPIKLDMIRMPRRMGADQTVDTGTQGVSTESVNVEGSQRFMKKGAPIPMPIFSKVKARIVRTWEETREYVQGPAPYETVLAQTLTD